MKSSFYKQKEDMILRKKADSTMGVLPFFYDNSLISLITISTPLL